MHASKYTVNPLTKQAGSLMKIISFMNHKGGVGKTTLTVNLARGIQNDDEPKYMMLVDADRQGSLRDWYESMNSCDISGMRVIGADRYQTLIGSVSVARECMSSYMMVDTPGDVHQMHGAAISISDLIIIPVRPSPYDVWSTQDTITLVKTCMVSNPKLKAMFILNQCIPNSNICSEAISALSEHPEIRLATNVISHRLSFTKTASEGKTVFETRDKLAINEVVNITKEIL